MRPSSGDETPGSGHRTGCTNLFTDSQTLSQPRGLPPAWARSHPVEHAKDGDGHPPALGEHPFRFGCLMTRACGRPRAAQASHPLGRGSSAAQSAGSPGWEKNQVWGFLFFFFLLFLPRFKAKGYLGLICCNIALGEIDHRMLG